MNKKVNIYSILYYLGYSLLMFATFFTNIDSFKEYLFIFKIIGIGILIFVILIQSTVYKTKSLMKILLFFIVVIIAWYSSKNSTTPDISLILLLLLLYSSKNVDFEKIVKIDCCLKLSYVLIMFLLFFMGIATDNLAYHNNIIRHSLGFSHANQLGIIISTIAIEYLYIHKGKINLFFILYLFFAFYILLVVTDSRASLLLLLMVCLGVLLQKFNFKKQFNYRVFSGFVDYSFVIMTLVTFLLVILYSNNTLIGIKLNSILSSRLFFAKSFLTHYKIGLFGNPLIFTGNDAVRTYGYYNQILDNTFLYILLRFGFLAYCMFGYLFYKIFKIAKNNGNLLLVWILFSFVIYGMLEKYTYIVFYNVFLLYFSFILFEKELVREGDKNE